MRPLGSAKPRPFPAERIERLLLQNGSHKLRVPTKEIDVLEGMTGHLRIVHGRRVYLTSGRLNEVVSRLGPRFLRASRSQFVNVESVERYASLPSGDVALTLRGNRHLLVSSRYAEAFLTALKPALDPTKAVRAE